jgi:hypothetical protein
MQILRGTQIKCRRPANRRELDGRGFEVVSDASMMI